LSVGRVIPCAGAEPEAAWGVEAECHPGKPGGGPAEQGGRRKTAMKNGVFIDVNVNVWNFLFDRKVVYLDNFDASSLWLAEFIKARMRHQPKLKAVDFVSAVTEKVTSSGALISLIRRVENT
jgi:hypothetical protein